MTTDERIAALRVKAEGWGRGLIWGYTYKAAKSIWMAQGHSGRYDFDAIATIAEPLLANLGKPYGITKPW